MGAARLFLLGLCAVLIGVSPLRAADPYPTRAVRLVVGFPAGGPTDIVARIMAQCLSERLGQQVIVENRPGAGSNVATQAVIAAPTDGYTLMIISPPHAINATLYKKLAPKATPAEIGEKLNRENNACLAEPKIKTRFAELGATPMIMTPAEFGAFLAAETEKWAKAVIFSGASVD